MSKYKNSNLKLYISIFTVLTFIPLVIFGAWVFTQLWAWFVVPTFGLAPLTIPAALGLSLLVNYLTSDWQTAGPEPGDSVEDFVKAAVKIYLKPFVFLLFGWIFTWFM